MKKTPLYNPDVFLFKLYAEQDLKSEYHDCIVSLFSICKDINEVNLIKHIVSKLQLLTERQVRHIIIAIIHEINDIVGDKPTAIVATSMGTDPDSSQLLVQLMKPLARDYKNLIFFNGVAPYTRKMIDYDHCFLVDEFAGTGRTIVQRIKQVKQEGKQRSKEVNIYVSLISAMEKAIELITPACEKVSAAFIQKPGISGYFIGTQLEENITIMNNIESRLCRYWKEKPLPNFGYGEAEALYSVHKWNAPNSNFPILWWPLYRNGKNRKVILIKDSP